MNKIIFVLIVIISSCHYNKNSKSQELANMEDNIGKASIESGENLNTLNTTKKEHVEIIDFKCIQKSVLNNVEIESYLISDTGTFSWMDLEFEIKLAKELDEGESYYTFSISKDGKNIFEKNDISNLTKISKHEINNEVILSFMLFTFYSEHSNKGGVYTVNLSQNKSFSYPNIFTKTCEPIYLKSYGWLAIDELSIVVLNDSLEKEIRRIPIRYDLDKQNFAYLDTYSISHLSHARDSIFIEFSPHTYEVDYKIYSGKLNFKADSIIVNFVNIDNCI